MKYTLSRIIPMPFRTIYATVHGPELAEWWQWRDRVFAHRVTRSI